MTLALKKDPFSNDNHATPQALTMAQWAAIDEATTVATAHEVETILKAARVEFEENEIGCFQITADPGRIIATAESAI